MPNVPRFVSTAAKDATDHFTFVVGPEHVKGSIVGDHHDCAGACALRARSDVVDAYVNRSVTYLKSNDGNWRRYLNPLKLRLAVDAFDDFGGLFAPGEYTLRPASPSETIIASRVRASVAQKRESNDPNRQIQRLPRTYRMR